MDNLRTVFRRTETYADLPLLNEAFLPVHSDFSAAFMYRSAVVWVFKNCELPSDVAVIGPTILLLSRVICADVNVHALTGMEVFRVLVSAGPLPNRAMISVLLENGAVDAIAKAFTYPCDFSMCIEACKTVETIARYASGRQRLEFGRKMVPILREKTAYSFFSMPFAEMALEEL